MKIIGGENAGMTGIITHVGSTGGCEVFFPSRVDRYDSFSDEWDFNLEKTEDTVEMDNKFKRGDRVVSETYPNLRDTVVYGVFAKPGEWWYYIEGWAGGELVRYQVPESDLTLKEEDNPIKDSGERTEFSTGAVRDLSAGKGNMEVMPWIALLRVSKHYENGAKKYGPRNYQKGIPVSSFLDSAIRHLAKYASGYDDEDHLSAAVFNCLGAILMEEEHPDMCDLPSREGKKKFHYDENNET